MKNSVHTRLALAGAAALLIVGLVFVSASPEDGAEAVAAGNSYQDRFDALEEFTPATKADLSELERQRLSFRTLMMAQELDPRNAGDLDGLERPEVRAYGRLELPDSSWAAMAAIGESICAWYVKGVGICGTPEQIETTGVAASGQLDDGRWRVLAIVPEKVETIEADPFGDGSFSFQAPVRSGVYSGEFPGRSIDVRGLNRDGEVVFRDTIPLDDFARGAGDR